MRRAVALGGLACAALVVAAVLLSRPDTGAPVGARAEPAPAPPVAGRRVRPPPPPTTDERGRPIAPGPEDPALLAKTLTPDSRGLAEAVVIRRERLQTCWSDYLARNPDVEGRFTLEMVVRGDGTRSEHEVNVVNADTDPDLEACATDALRDAVFGVTNGVQRVVYPVPVGG